MAPSRLPPPPERPERPPPTRLAHEQPVRIANGAVALEAQFGRGSETHAVLVCHPHPLYGGTMDNAVVVALCKAAAARGATTLRFNFRGVGRSGGGHEGGPGELSDVIAALRFVTAATAPGAVVDLIGYSFGSWVGLDAARAADAPAVRGLALLAPAPALFPYAPEAARPVLARRGTASVVAVGTRDQYCTLDEARALADALGAAFVPLEGRDHFFTSDRRALAAAVLDALAARGSAGAQSEPPG